MARRKRRTADTASPPEDEESLSDEVRSLREEVRVLRESIDDFREAFDHTVRNLPDRLPPVLRVWSLPADPAAPDFGERINAVPADQLELLRAEAVRAAEDHPSLPQAARQGRLFS